MSRTKLFALVASLLFVTGMASASAATVCDPSCYPKLTCADRLAKLEANHCVIPVTTEPCRTDCATKDDITRLVAANKALADARVAAVPPSCKPVPCWPIPADDAVQPKPMGFWSLGPTAGYTDGPFLGVAGGYTFANPRAPQIVGSVTRHRLDGGGVWFTPPPCPHEKPEDPLVPYPSETVWGAGVTLLWRLP